MNALVRSELSSETDFWRIRNFLREVFLLNGRLEHSWHVARLDHWYWHFILTCRIYDSYKGVTTMWQTGDGQLAAVLLSYGAGEIRLHVHPYFRTPDLEDEMLATAEERLGMPDDHGRLRVYLPVNADDALRQGVLLQRGYEKVSGVSQQWRRDLDEPIPDAPTPSGYVIRSMGTDDELPARSWASWRAFHADEPDEAYDGDWSWYRNLQSGPLYRRDLDVVAVTEDGAIASFVTMLYDDYTRSAVCVLVGTAADHWRRGVGRATILEGFRRLQRLGCTRVFATGFDPVAAAFYGSVMQHYITAETWTRLR